ncbi:hypothetical protein [Helicobacter sp. T3_23-1056]
MIQIQELVQVGKVGRVVGLKGRLCFWLSSDFAEFLLHCAKSSEEVCVKRASLLESSEIKSSDFDKKIDSNKNDFSRLDSKFENLKIKAFIKQKDKYFIEFVGIDNASKAKIYVNAELYATKAQSRAHCTLKKDEFFYFDIVGLDIMQDSENLGVVRDIERIGNIDYLVVEAREDILESFIKNPIKKSKKTSQIKTSDVAQNPTKSKPPKSKLPKSKKTTKTKKPKTFLVPYIDRFVLEVSLKKGAIFTQNAKEILEQS